MKLSRIATCGVLLVALSSGSAVAGGKSGTAGQATPSPSDLPGVNGAYSIVTPLPPEPDDDKPTGQFGHFRVGNFDVKVSGKLTYDIGVGTLRPSKR